MDLEDSVAAVDADDKVLAYANWLGLMQGSLTASFDKDGRATTRSLNPDTAAVDPAGKPLSIRRRGVMLIRSVGLHMETDMVRWEGRPTPETLIDVAVAAWCALCDLSGAGPHRNSQTGSVYIVMPKLHGPREVGLVRDLLAATEGALGMAPNTLKLGIMDEERRTSLNLAACIAEAAERVAFINTGFLDRTGDDIHTGMEAGPMPAQSRDQVGGMAESLRRGQRGRGAGHGVAGPCPDRQGDVGPGPTTWRPCSRRRSPTPGQAPQRPGSHRPQRPPSTPCTIWKPMSPPGKPSWPRRPPTATPPSKPCCAQPSCRPGRELSPTQIQRELDNNAQGILGYAARWVGRGVGCSKVLDIDGVALMEDRATLRISSQHIANWLHHGLLSEAQVVAAMRRMAAVVDGQNAGDPGYEPMSGDFASSIPFNAALALVLEGRIQPNGYTEPILTAHRRRQKAVLGGRENILGS